MCRAASGHFPPRLPGLRGPTHPSSQLERSLTCHSKRPEGTLCPKQDSSLFHLGAGATLSAGLVSRRCLRDPAPPGLCPAPRKVPSSPSGPRGDRSEGSPLLPLTFLNALAGSLARQPLPGTHHILNSGPPVTLRGQKEEARAKDKPMLLPARDPQESASSLPGGFLALRGEGPERVWPRARPVRPTLSLPTTCINGGAV